MPARENDRPAKRNERVRKIRRKRRIKILLSLLAIVLSILLVLCITVFFPIKNISVSIGAYYTAEQVIEASDIEVGDNIIVAGWFNQSEKIQTKLPYIKSVSYKKSLEGNLVIETKLTSEKYAFIGKDASLVADSDLKILREHTDENSGLVTVYLYGDLSGDIGRIGELTDAADASLFSFVTDAVEQRGIKINTVDLSRSYNIALKVSDRFIVELGSKSDFNEKLAHLAVMLERIDEGKSGVIDLSSWNVSNEEAYFKERDIGEYFTERHTTKPELTEEDAEGDGESSSESLSSVVEKS